MAITEQDEDGVELEVYPEALTSYFQKKNPDYFEIHDAMGHRLFSSASLSSEQVLIASGIASDRVVDVRLPDGRNGRLIQRGYYPKVDLDDDVDVGQATRRLPENMQSDAFAPSGKPTTIDGVVITPEPLHVTVATSRFILDENINQLNIMLLLTGFVTLTVVILLQRNAIRRAVAPIQDISNQIKLLDVNELDKKLVLRFPIVELQTLTDQFNDLLFRLREGFQRERRFSSDLAHEMRTPLAELKSLAEVSQRWPDDETLKASFSNDVVNSVSRMERLIQSLKALSRGDNALSEKTSLVDLRALISHVVSSHQSDLVGRGHSYHVSVPDDTVLVEGRDHWPYILENLINNATDYSSASSLIELSLTVDRSVGTFAFTIENEAHELTEDDLKHMFDRLWRKDAARASSHHSGLGLSLVQMYASAVAVTIRTELIGEVRLRMTLEGTLKTPVERTQLSTTSETGRQECAGAVFDKNN